MKQADSQLLSSGTRAESASGLLENSKLAQYAQEYEVTCQAELQREFYKLKLRSRYGKHKELVHATCRQIPSVDTHYLKIPTTYTYISLISREISKQQGNSAVGPSGRISMVSSLNFACMFHFSSRDSYCLGGYKYIYIQGKLLQ